MSAWRLLGEDEDWLARSRQDAGRVLVSGHSGSMSEMGARWSTPCSKFCFVGEIGISLYCVNLCNARHGLSFVSRWLSILRL